ncbi:MAG: hypothetical protein RLZZ387_3053 [Chloroflexota bacterium]|jgi:uncharacterized alkaline shock family protein YloU
MSNVEHTTSELPAGRIEVMPRAIATIAARAARTLSGVAGLVPPTARDGTAQVLPAHAAHRGVEVHLRGDELTVELYLIVAYGAPVADVARSTQERVREALEHALGSPVARVHVRVQGLGDPA